MAKTDGRVLRVKAQPFLANYIPLTHGLLPSIWSWPGFEDDKARQHVVVQKGQVRDDGMDGAWGQQSTPITIYTVKLIDLRPNSF